MPITLEELGRQTRKQLLQELTPEERTALLEGLSAEKRLEGLSAEKRLEGLSPEERLQGLTPEQAREVMELLTRRLQQNAEKPPQT